jgi:hypothetical protein
VPKQAQHSTFLAAVRREWWIPIAVMVIAGAIAAVVSSADSAPLFEGRAIVVIDSATLSKFPDLPRPDDMLREVKSAEFVSKLASETLVASDTVAAKLSAYTREDPQRQIVITFRSPSEPEASRVASAAATAAAKLAGELGGMEIWELQRRVNETQRALKEVLGINADAGGARTEPQFRLDLASAQWEMRMRLYEDQLSLRTLKYAYYYNGNIAVTDVAPVRRRGATIAGAIVLGLVLGLVIGVFREAIMMRPRREEEPVLAEES